MNREIATAKFLYAREPHILGRKLTPYESKIFDLLEKRVDCHTIAWALGITVNSVYSVRTAIRQKGYSI